MGDGPPWIGAPWPLRWLFTVILYVAAYRPVVMTASRRDCLVNDAESLTLAMRVIEELRAELRAARPSDPEPSR